MKNKILFICEGEATEKKFCNFIIDKYFIKKNKPKEYVAFGTNIYGLYDEMNKDNGLDIVELIKERAIAKSDWNNYNKLKDGGFSEIYLIFDFDMQAPQYTKEKIIEMVKFFDNETENGKLYINYPMIESFKHFKSIPDPNFADYMVSCEECLNYKKLVNDISVIPHFNDINEDILSIIIKQGIEKLSKILNVELIKYYIYEKNCGQMNILSKQLESLIKNDKIYVLNTSLFWGIDYFGENLFNIYNSVELNYLVTS